VNLLDVIFPATPREKLELGGALDGVEVRIRIGVAEQYVNRVSLRLQTGETIAIAPFFYGRPGEREISSTRGAQQWSETLHEANAFQEMFAVPRRVWLETQNERSEKMLAVTSILERLASALLSARRTAGCAISPIAAAEERRF